MMTFFSNIRMKPKLLFLFIFTGLVPLAIVALVGGYSATTALMDLAFDQLRTIQSIKRDKLETTLTERINGLKIIANYRQTQQALDDFLLIGQTVDPLSDYPSDSPGYARTFSRYHSQFQQYIGANGFTDLYILDAKDGHIMYVANQGPELGANVRLGRFKQNPLSKVWSAVLRTSDIVFEDFAPYELDAHQQSAFIGYPVRDQNGIVAGVIIVRITGQFLNHIMSSRQGLGESGESYLVRWYEYERRFELRSNLQTMGHGRYVIGFSLDQIPEYWHEAATKGFDGGSGTYRDSAGSSVLVAYNTLDVLGINWLLVSKINKQEVLRPIWTFLLVISATGIILALMIAPGAYGLARGISGPLEKGVRFAEAISAGDLNARLHLARRDELGLLAKSLNRMARNLREMNWVSQGKAGLDDVLRGEHLPEELSKFFIHYICKHLNCPMGLFFLHENEELVLTASYAFTSRKGNFSRFCLGEGLVGQAGLEKTVLTFTGLQGNAPTYNNGTEEIIPTHFLAAPLLVEDKLIAVFLLASDNDFSPLQQQFIKEILLNAGILFNMALSRGTINTLLNQAQEQQEKLRVANEELEEQTNMLKNSQAELQAQQEELRVTNEELTEQAEALKKSEQRLQEQQAELQFANDKLGERTTELEEQKYAIRKKNKDLLRSRKELEAASKYKSEFLANMSHELRTPLNSILILSQLLSQNKDSNLSERQVESAKAIHSSGADLLKLINEILDLSKIEAGRVELHLEEMSMSSMIADLQRIFQGVAANKKISFVVDLNTNVPESIVTDPHRVQQILRNLLSNAFKFTSQGSVSLIISRPQKDADIPESIAPGQGICIAVRDQGIGIPKDKQESIFEAFRQADGSTSRKYGGTGLGLSISRELAKLLGGEITLESEEDKGATFTLILPEAHPGAQNMLTNMGTPPKTESTTEEDVPEDDHLEDSARPFFQASAPSQNYLTDDRDSIAPGDKLILIVEDDLNFARILRDQARDLGFKTLVAPDGETGLHYADFYSPSAIILDIGLPGVDGWAVMERLKNDATTRHIPVHFISAEDSTLDAMRMGAIGFLTKPVDMETLQKTFDKIIGFIEKPIRRLLVVDDDPIQRESIKALIGEGDVETITAGSGAETLDLLKTQDFDCMILDLGLPDMSGFEVLQKIRSGQGNTNLPVVVYTGRELSTDEEHNIKKYAESIIVKGVRSPERLLEETTLFLHRLEGNLPKSAQQIEEPTVSKESPLDGRTILLVDDDMRNVFALSSVLEDKGLEIIIARDGQESLNQLKGNPSIDLVLMDIMMPVMDGYEAMRQIRKNPDWKDLPIIALTAKAMKGDKGKCIDAGANDYLAKPVDTDKLLSLLRVWLYRK